MGILSQVVLALDLGTTGNRALLFDPQGQIVGQAYRELTQYYPQPGWVEHDPQQIWDDTLWAMQTAIAQAQIQPNQITAIGLTVQRETCLLWDRTTGIPLHRAIVWQDRRTAAYCDQLRDQGVAAELQARTGLVLDAYFSASKLRWLLDWLQEHPEAAPADPKNLLAGTIDTWVLWKLTGGQVHATDTSNASRTLLMNLATQSWDDWSLNLFNISPHLLPEIRPSLGDFGTTDPNLTGAAIPIQAIFGDQQAALFAHGCHQPGLLKCTYGTGAFLVAHTGAQIVRSQHQLLSTVAWTQANQPVGYALEGSMFTAGSCIQWLRDGLQLVTHASETDAIAREVLDNAGVYFVPALSGLGAPHWNMGARGAFLGLTSGVTRAHLVRAVLEAIAFQVRDVVQAVNEDCGQPITTLKVDGGACQNDFLMQFQADVLGIPIERPTILDATAQGAAFGAGLAVGFWDSYEQLIAARQLDRVFTPGPEASQYQDLFHTWLRAVERAKDWII
jgi:glycerol kinase